MKKETVKIGYREYTIKFVKRVDKDDACGECDYAKGIIRIKKTLKGDELANTIQHEINHAILYDRDVDLPTEVEERVVTAMANGHMAFIRDNPKYVIKLLRMALKK